MTPAAAADGSAEGDGAGNAELPDEHKAQIEAELQDLIGRLEGRLHEFEPYRAQLQLEARKSEGRPLDAETERLLAAHLSHALEGERDYRLLTALRSALRRWHGVAEPVVAEEQSAPGAPLNEAAPLPHTEPEPDAVHAAASAAVAAMFVASAAPPEVVPLAPAESSAPVVPPPPPKDQEIAAPMAVAVPAAVPVVKPEVTSPSVEATQRAIAELARIDLNAAAVADALAVSRVLALAAFEQPALGIRDSTAIPAVRAAESSRPAPPPAAPPSGRVISPPPPWTDVDDPVHSYDPVEAAEADVLASLAKLRTPAPGEGAPVSGFHAQVSSGLVRPAPVQASQTTWPKTLGPKSPPLSLEGTMANVAKAVAATVATAGRIAEPASERRAEADLAADAARRSSERHERAPFARPQPSEVQARADNMEALIVEETEIRFVARPANPAIDTPPPIAPAAIVGDDTQPLSADAPAGWEEASIEIRRPEAVPAPAGIRTDLPPTQSGRAGVLNRFVKVLRGEKV